MHSPSTPHPVVVRTHRKMTEDLDFLLPAISAGDPEAFGDWMARVEASVRSSLRSFAKVVDTEAVLQEGFLRVWQVAPRFHRDGRPNGLLRLAVRITRNLAISEVRKQKSRPAEADELERRMGDAIVIDPPTPADPNLAAIIRKCQEALPSKPGQALAARLDNVRGLPDAQLAERVGMRKNTFLQNVSRARKFLETCLGEHGVDLEAELS